MHIHVSGRGIEIPLTNHGRLSGNNPHPLNRHASSSFGSPEFSQNVSPLRLNSNTKGLIKHTGAKTSNDLDDLPEDENSAAHTEVRNIGLMLMNPDQHLTIASEISHRTKNEAINKIIKYIKNRQDSVPFLTDSLRILRQVINSDPAENKEVQEALYKFLGEKSTSDLTKKLTRNLNTSQFFISLVQDDAHFTFKNFNLEEYLNTFKKSLSKEILEFWNDFSTKEKSEKSLVQEMEKMILEKLNSLSSEMDIGAQLIPILFANISRAEREKINLFGMLYRLSKIKIVLDGDNLRLLVLTVEHELNSIWHPEQKIIAHEACKRLASTSAILARRYETLLRRDARETLLKTNLSEFSLQILLTKDPLLKNIFHSLLSDPDTVQSEKDLLLESLVSFLKKEADKPNMGTEAYQLTIQILFYYGKSLIEKDTSHRKNKTYQTVLRALEDVQGAEVIQENSIFSLEALRILKSTSKEGSLENSRMAAASYLTSLSPYFATYFWSINAALTASPTRSRTEIEGDLVREEILERIKWFESAEMSLKVEKLFEEISYTSMDEKYRIIEAFKHSVINKSEEIENQNFLTSSTWRHFLLLSLSATKALQSSTDSNSRFLLLITGELQDLCHTSSVLNNELASISLKVLREHAPRSLLVRALEVSK
ncbi:uncharacterized protein MELLADRAFT_106127 [Melampsora larici-populina 98AG31]|uniref:Uncharacterized protein n=1 Tax=Melampsora larici-populina (strain 98AG31 / pathotype 3-4-7) TaxID=747676 RepID=F4RKH4_MELLP|nr:uncharacterized protein MELLADRAFT_106127 [Melampsora larici-populina 98AG31]EGG07096.1 hypothetical protein MELLADRAFT_106127 [Melampsora larici-populina 98AG31]